MALTETIGVEEEVDEDDPMDEGAVLCDEIDSSKMIDEVEALILQEPTHLPMDQVDTGSDHNDVQIVGSHIEKYTRCEFSSQAATN